jgi:rhamnosyltransferase
MQHVFIVGAKGFTYGGYETFLDKLTEYHKDNKDIQYHIACKANGSGMTDETKLNGVQILSDTEYIYHNAHCFKIHSPEIGNAQAIIYDIKALQYCCEYIKKNNIEHPIVYVLSSRVGPVMGYFARKIHKFGGKYYNNPDGRESLRKKYHPMVRKYWALSERGMVKHSDLVICDSVNIEKYIQDEYKQYHPKTTYIAYGSDVIPSTLADDDPKYVEWLKKFNLTPRNFYISVGRFVPENNFETMIREFMKSKTEKDFAIITTRDDKFLAELDQKLHFSQDRRIKFVGTVYDQELLKKIRENAYGYFHGHEVGGTNPSLLEALGATKLNLLYDVGFNREVAEDAALYWSKKEGKLASLIDQADQFEMNQIQHLGDRAKNRIRTDYSWEHIANEYEKVILK